MTERTPNPMEDRPDDHSRHSVAVGILLVILTVKISEALYFDSWMARVDILTTFLPTFTLLGEQLRNFDIPGWNPYRFSGAPLAGDPQSGWGYLPVMIPFMVLSPITAFKCFVAIQLTVGTLSTYAFARSLRFGAAGSLVTSLAYLSGPFFIYNTSYGTDRSFAATWLPLGLFGLERGLQSSSLRGRIGSFTVAGFAVSQMLAGGIGQGAYNGLLMLGTYLVFRSLVVRPHEGSTWRNRILMLGFGGAVMVAVGGGLGAASVLPRLDVNRETNLAGGNYAEVQPPRTDEEWASPRGVILRVLDTRTSRGTRTAIGGAILVLACVSPLVAWRHAIVWYFLIASLAISVMMLKPTLLHHLLYLLPGFRTLHEHAPHRIMGVFSLGPALLAGAVVSTISIWTRRWKLAIVVAITPIVILGLLRTQLSPSLREILVLESSSGFAWIGASALLFVPVAGHLISLLRRWSWQPRWDGVLIALVLMLILWEPSGRRLVTSLGDAPRSLATSETIAANTSATDPDGAGEFLQQQMSQASAPFRFIGYDAANHRTSERTDGLIYHARVRDPLIQALLVNGHSTYLGLYSAQGYNPIQFQHYVELFQAINGQRLNYHDAYVLPSGLFSPLLNLLSVRFIVVPSAVPPGRPDLLHLSQRLPTVFDNGTVRVLENKAALPAAWIVHDVLCAPDDEAFRLISSGDVDPRSTAILEEDVPTVPLAAPGSAGPESVTVTHYEADQITLTATLQAPGLIVLSEVYSHGWHAYVDGERTTIYLADGALRAVPVGMGTHDVELRYEPGSLQAGIAITTLTVLAISVGTLGFCLPARRRERRRQ